MQNKLRYILLELTDECNFRCKHCRVDAWEKIKNLLTKEEIFNIVDQAADLEVKTITFSGGEPLLRKEVHEIIKYCSKKGINAKLQSNGSLFDNSTAEQLKLAGLKIFGTGIDGSKPEIHNALRNNNMAFEKMISAIRLAKKQGFEIHTETTITKLNYADIENIIDLAEQLGVDYFFVRSMVIAGQAQKELILSKEEYRLCLERVFAKKYKMEKIKITSQDPLFHLADKNLMMHLEKTYGDIYSGSFIGGCSVGLNSINIKSDGDVRLCTFLQLKIGNVRDSAISELWTNKNKYCGDIVARKFTGKCASCKDRLICGGCRARALHVNKDVLAEDPFCWK